MKTPPSFSYHPLSEVAFYYYHIQLMLMQLLTSNVAANDHPFFVGSAGVQHGSIMGLLRARRKTMLDADTTLTFCNNSTRVPINRAFLHTSIATFTDR